MDEPIEPGQIWQETRRYEESIERRTTLKIVKVVAGLDVTAEVLTDATGEPPKTQKPRRLHSYTLRTKYRLVSQYG